MLALYRPSFATRLDDGVYDHVVRWGSPHAPDGGVVIVDIDERSLRVHGQWPWRRKLIAELVERLRRAGAAVVALDIIFAEKDRSGDNDDARLAEALHGRGVVLGYGLTFDEDETRGQDCGVDPLSIAIINSGGAAPGQPLFRPTGAVCSLPALVRAAPASGFLNAAPDRDGILRRIPLLVERDGLVYPSLALAAVTSISGARNTVLRASNDDSSLLTHGGTQVPLDGKGNLLLRFRGGKRTFPYLSAADVLGDGLDHRFIRDRVVLVGTTALGTREVVATPLDTLFVGVEVQATVVDNLMRADFARRPEHQRMIESAVTLLIAGSATLLIARRGMAVGGVLSLGALAALWMTAVSLLATRGVFVSPLFPTMAWLAAVTVAGVVRFRMEWRRADTAGAESAAARALMIQALLSLTEVRDAETGKHSRRTQQYTKLLAEALSTHPRFAHYLTPERIDLLSSLAPLHDIGKVGVPDSILNKPGALTPEEFAEMRRHTVYGRDVIINAEHKVAVKDDVILTLAKEIVYTHHERWDGKGYPEGMHGEDIPVPGRIIAVVDVFDALTTRSLYKAPLSHADATAHICGGSGSHFDPAVVEAFIRVAPAFHVLAAQSVAEPIPA